MKRFNILAHRGIFFNKNIENSEEALCTALSNRFGIETDLRDFGGKIVISHDPPREGSSPIRWFSLND